MNLLPEKEQAGIWIINAEAQTVYANGRMAEILGASVSEMMGQPSFVYVFPQDIPAAQQLFDSKKRGDSGPFRFQLRRKDGSAVGVSVQGTPMHSESGGFKGIVGTFSVVEAAYNSGTA